ncbi:MAG: hypothetical protein WCL30_05220, partial [Pseudomonadota bacterium]
ANLFETLKAHEFIGQDGKKVDLDKLQKSLESRFKSLSHGFNACATHCPLINSALAKLGEKSTNLSSIVIASIPETDGANQAARDSFMKTMKDRRISQDIIILYPSKDGKVSDNAAKATQLAFANYGHDSNANEISQHPAQISLFSPQGDELLTRTYLNFIKDLDKKAIFPSQGLQK